MKSVLVKLEGFVNGDFLLDKEGVLDIYMYDLRNALDRENRESPLDKVFDITHTIETSLRASL